MNIIGKVEIESVIDVVCDACQLSTRGSSVRPMK